jgi:hypothetical protein
LEERRASGRVPVERLAALRFSSAAPLPVNELEALLKVRAPL